jgi:hypothetical protein
MGAARWKAFKAQHCASTAATKGQRPRIALMQRASSVCEINAGHCINLDLRL